MAALAAFFASPALAETPTIDWERGRAACLNGAAVMLAARPEFGANFGPEVCNCVILALRATPPDQAEGRFDAITRACIHMYVDDLFRKK